MKEMLGLIQCWVCDSHHRGIPREKYGGIVKRVVEVVEEGMTGGYQQPGKLKTKSWGFGGGEANVWE